MQISGKSLFLAVSVVLSSVFPLFAADTAMKTLLTKVDALVTFESNDFSAEYTIVQDKPGEGQNTTVAAVFRRDRLSKYLILVLKPDVNKGQGYLKMDDNLWFYDPVSRKFTFTSSKERFQNSNARNSDFTRSNLARDYDVVGTGKEKLGKFDCQVLNLKANNDQVTFPQMKVWISDDLLVRKTEDYSLSGQLMRTTAIPTYQKVGNRFIPQAVLIIDNLKGKTINGKFSSEKTQITIAKPSLETMPDILFTKTYLEKVAK